MKRRKIFCGEVIQEQLLKANLQRFLFFFFVVLFLSFYLFFIFLETI